MTEPWFNPAYAWLPGTVLGCVCGLIGALAGCLIPRGKGKTLVLGSLWSVFSAAVVMLVAGIVALVSGQPYDIWYGLGLAGLIGVVVIGCNAPQVHRFYRMAEARRMQAQDLD
jgi:hypothetical protein